MELWNRRTAWTTIPTLVVPLFLCFTDTKNKEMEQERLKTATRRLLQHLDQGAQPSNEDFAGFGLDQET